MKGMKRRDFIKGTLAAGAALSLPGIVKGQTAQSADAVMGSNDDLRVAVVGFCRQGGGHINGFKRMKGARLVALCDVDQEVMNKRVQELKGDDISVKTYTDFRKLLEDKDIDVVSIATPHHHHCWMTVAACQAGKDVYIEKPLSHNVWEGRKVMEAAQKYNRIVQVGTQRRADGGWQEAAEWLQAGNLGKMLYSRGFCYKRRASIGKVAAATPIPSTVDYDLWCGPREMKPLMREELHYDWHWVWDTGNGDLGNQGVHQMDVANWMIGVKELPQSVISIGGRFGYVDDGETANTQIVILDYKPTPVIFEVRGLPMKAGMQAMDRYKPSSNRGTDIGNVIECEGGFVMEGTAYDKDGAVIKKFETRSGGNIRGNFVQCVRSRKQEDLVCPPLAGHISASLCHLGNISHLVGQQANPEEITAALKGNAAGLEVFERFKEHLAANEIDLKVDKAVLGAQLKIDPKTERFVGDGPMVETANSMLKGSYRAGFEIPETV